MSQPSILFILSDQHRFDCLGRYGNERAQTPHLARLAGDGVRFEQTFCTHPVCAPARNSILSGLYPHQNTCPHNCSTLPPSLPSFPRILKQHGYRTKAVGEMHFTRTYLDVGFHNMLRKGPALYDPLVRVPLIVKFPAGRDSGTVRTDLASHPDLAPTILGQAGVPLPEGMVGLNLCRAPLNRDMVFAEVITEGLV